MRAAGAALVLVLLALAGCSGTDAPDRPASAATTTTRAATSPRPSTLAASWARLWTVARRHVNTPERPAPAGPLPLTGRRPVRLAPDVTVLSAVAAPDGSGSWRACVAGPLGARLSITRRVPRDDIEADTTVYRFGTGTCAAPARVVVADDTYPYSVRHGEAAAQRVAPLARLLTEQRASSVQIAVQDFSRAARALRGSTGRFPERYARAAFESHGFYASRGEHDDYRPAADGSSYTLCVQYGDDGPWRGFVSGTGVVNLADSGRCSLRPAASGSLAGVLIAAERIGPVAEALTHTPYPSARATRAIRRSGVSLGAGNRLVDIRHEAQADGVTGSMWCVQHGTHGAWVVTDPSVGTRAGRSGSCSWRVTEPER